MSGAKRYWFRAKRYGWGWGLPLTWQGWAVLVVFFFLVVLDSVLFPPVTRLGMHLGYLAVLCVLLVGVCYAKGEPPKWRWGER